MMKINQFFFYLAPRTIGSIVTGLAIKIVTITKSVVTGKWMVRIRIWRTITTSYAPTWSVLNETKMWPVTLNYSKNQSKMEKRRNDTIGQLITHIQNLSKTLFRHRNLVWFLLYTNFKWMKIRYLTQHTYNVLRK